MQRVAVLYRCALAGATLAAAATPSPAQTRTFGYFDIVGQHPWYGGILDIGTAVNSDKTAVVGWTMYNDGFSTRTEGWRYDPDDTTRFFGVSQSFAADVSDGGDYVVGSYNSRPIRWTRLGGTEYLRDSGGSLLSGGAGGITADGQVIVGSATFGGNTQAFRWTPATGAVSLGDLPGGANRSYADGVWSEPGDPSSAIIVGESAVSGGDVAFVWRSFTGMVSLGDFSGGQTRSRARDTNRRYVVGEGVSGSGIHGFVHDLWNSNSGLTALPDLPGGPVDCAAWAISESTVSPVIVGYAKATTSAEAVRWRKTGSSYTLERVSDLMAAVGVSTQGVRLDHTYGISGDGTLMLGDGFHPSFGTVSWIAGLLELYDGVVPAVCLDADESATFDNISMPDYVNAIEISFRYDEFMDDFSKASDLKVTLTDADGRTLSIGGDFPVNEWDFQGPGSTSPGWYSTRVELSEDWRGPLTVTLHNDLFYDIMPSCYSEFYLYFEQRPALITDAWGRVATLGDSSVAFSDNQGGGGSGPGSSFSNGPARFDNGNSDATTFAMSDDADGSTDTGLVDSVGWAGGSGNVSFVIEAGPDTATVSASASASVSAFTGRTVDYGGPCEHLPSESPTEYQALQLVTQNFGASTPPGGPGDFDGDGEVGPRDLLLSLNPFAPGGPCEPLITDVASEATFSMLEQQSVGFYVEVPMRLVSFSGDAMTNGPLSIGAIWQPGSYSISMEDSVSATNGAASFSRSMTLGFERAD